MWETWVWSLGWEDPLEKGKGTHSSILAWRIPWSLVHGAAKSQTWLSDFHFHRVWTQWCGLQSLPCTILPLAPVPSSSLEWRHLRVIPPLPEPTHLKDFSSNAASSEILSLPSLAVQALSYMNFWLFFFIEFNTAPIICRFSWLSSISVTQLELPEIMGGSHDLCLYIPSPFHSTSL